jgi:hypothetical protein
LVALVIGPSYVRGESPFSLENACDFHAFDDSSAFKTDNPQEIHPRAHFPPKICKRFQAETDGNWGWITEFLLVVFQEEMSLNPRIRGFADPVFSQFQPLQTSPRISEAKPPNLVSSSLSISNHFTIIA